MKASTEKTTIHTTKIHPASQSRQAWYGLSVHTGTRAGTEKLPTEMFVADLNKMTPMVIFVGS